MRKYGYQRPSATLRVTRKRPVRRKKPSFFFKFLFLLFLLIVLLGALFFGGRYLYFTLKNAQITDWHVKSVAVEGLSGVREKEIFNKVVALEGKPFSGREADLLRQELVAKYPTLAKVSVSRGMLSGKLKITARPRQPVAQFILPDQSRKYIDEESIVYADPLEMRAVLPVNLIGKVPAKLDESFVELVQNLLKLKKTLAFESIEYNATDNTVTLTLPDQSVIHFGAAVQLKQKVKRAAQIMMFAREKYQEPVSLDFTFFEKGKVFLTKSPQ